MLNVQGKGWRMNLGKGTDLSKHHIIYIYNTRLVHLVTVSQKHRTEYWKSCYLNRLKLCQWKYSGKCGIEYSHLMEKHRIWHVRYFPSLNSQPATPKILLMGFLKSISATSKQITHRAWLIKNTTWLWPSHTQGNCNSALRFGAQIVHWLASENDSQDEPTFTSNLVQACSTWNFGTGGWKDHLTSFCPETKTSQTPSI